MRKLKRSIARANMKAAGIGNINRKRVVQTLEGRVETCSFFSKNWRKWVSGNPYAKKSRKKSRKVQSMNQNRDEVWDALKAHGKQVHQERVAKNSDRIQYAIEQFKKNNIEFVLKNESNGHFHCRRQTDDRLFQFWAGTGKILGYPNLRGIHALIRLLKGGG